MPDRVHPQSGERKRTPQPFTESLAATSLRPLLKPGGAESQSRRYDARERMTLPESDDHPPNGAAWGAATISRSDGSTLGDGHLAHGGDGGRTPLEAGPQESVDS